jgi:polyisoprenoid-binding protein YceI
MLGRSLNGSTAARPSRADCTQRQAPKGINESKPAGQPEPSAGAPAITPENPTIGFVGSKVTGSHTGGFKLFKGTFEVVPANLESSKITAEIDTNSIFSDTDCLTKYLKGQANDLIRDEVVIKLAIHAPVK